MNIEKYLAAKNRATKLPQIQVSRDEFVRLLIERGETPEKAEQTAKIAEGLGSYVEISESMVGIKGKS